MREKIRHNLAQTQLAPIHFKQILSNLSACIILNCSHNIITKIHTYSWGQIYVSHLLSHKLRFRSAVSPSSSNGRSPGKKINRSIDQLIPNVYKIVKLNGGNM